STPAALTEDSCRRPPSRSRRAALRCAIGKLPSLRRSRLPSVVTSPLVSSSLAHSVVPQQLPNFGGRYWYVDVTYSQGPQSVDYRVHDRRGSAYGSRFAYTFCTERMMRRRRAGLISFPFGRLDGRRHEVVHEAAVQVVAALVVLNLFIHRRRQSDRQ